MSVPCKGKSTQPVQVRPKEVSVRKQRSGRFTVLRQTMRKRMQAKLRAVKAEQIGRASCRERV